MNLIEQNPYINGAKYQDLLGRSIYIPSFSQAPIPAAPFLLDMAEYVVNNARFEVTDGALAGRSLWSPGAFGNYYGSVMVVRDQCMAIRSCPWLFTAEQIQGVAECVLACCAASPDGGVQDGMRPDSSVFGYGGGGITASPLDNVYWLVSVIYSHFLKTGAATLFSTHESEIMGAMDSQTIDAGLVYADGSAVEYGFVDSILISGVVSHVSLFRFQANRQIAAMLRSLGRTTEADAYDANNLAIRNSLESALYDEAAQMLHFCNGTNTVQHSVAASAYAVVLNALSPAVCDAISASLLARLTNGDGGSSTITLNGQAYVFPTDEPYFTEFRTGIPAGAYQNGGAWAVHTGILAKAIARTDVAAGNAIMGQWLTANVSLPKSVRPYEVESRPGGSSWTPSYPYMVSATDPLLYYSSYFTD
jgi:hypothetical protein